MIQSENQPNEGIADDGAPGAEPAPQPVEVAFIDRLLADIEAADQLAEANPFGIRADILRQFLILLRDRYPLVDKANFFLEREQGVSGINVAITNQRDALSHFVTLLSKPGLPEEEQLKQLAHAEEHLRRATLEPYAIAVALEAKKLLDLRTIYVDEVIPLAEDPRLSAAPDLARINAVLREMKEMRTLAREAKARNTWDAGWEEGVTALVAVFTKARELHEKLEHYVAVARQIREQNRQGEHIQHQISESEHNRELERRNRSLTILNTLLAVVSVVLAIVSIVLAMVAL